MVMWRSGKKLVEKNSRAELKGTEEGVEITEREKGKVEEG